MINANLFYSGTKQPAPGDLDSNGRPLLPYVPSDELKDAINLAILLKRPLLLRGEPGSGKSLFASAVAYELGLPLEVWTIRSTTRADDGLYIYDAIRRLHDTQLAVAAGQGAGRRQFKRPNNTDFGRYIRFGPIGRVFRAPQRTVLLIDEVDKADIDFPNDLLEVLEVKYFRINETGETIVSQHPPIILITSNDEKELPDAFLRRCVFAYIPFPDEDRLKAILTAHFGAAPQDLIARAVQRFWQLRKRQDEDVVAGIKKVSTSELIDWMRVMVQDPNKSLRELEAGKPYPHQAVLVKRVEDQGTVKRPIADELTIQAATDATAVSNPEDASGGAAFAE